MLETILQCPRCGSQIRLSLFDLIPSNRGLILTCGKCSGQSVFPRNTRYLLTAVWLVYLGVLVFALRSIWLLVPAFLLGTPLLLVFLIRRWPKLIPFDMPPTMRRLDKALDNLAIPIVLLLAYGVFHLLVKRGQLG